MANVRHHSDVIAVPRRSRLLSIGSAALALSAALVVALRSHRQRDPSDSPATDAVARLERDVPASGRQAAASNSSRS